MALNEKKKTSKLNEDFIKNYDEDSEKRYILEVDVEYAKKILFNKHKSLPFLPRLMGINKCEKPVCNIHNKK